MSYIDETQKSLRKIAALIKISAGNDSEKAQEYDVFVDDVRVVPRTDKADLLLNVCEIIDEDTQKVLVRLFHGSSNTSEPKEFVKSPEALNGVGVTEKEIRRRLDKEYKEKRRVEDLEEENEEQPWSYSPNEPILETHHGKARQR